MKKIIFLTLLGFCLLSCVSTQKAVALVENEPIYWKQQYFPKIQVSDSVFFYNPDSIKIEKIFAKKTFFVENGVVKEVDSLSTVSNIVPRLTAGLISSIVSVSSGEIKNMIISFSRDEAIYNLTYIKKEDGSFILNNKAQILFNNHFYGAEVSTLNPGLLFYLEKYKVEEKKSSIATGHK